jgi:PAS domain S-box-containing protein
LAAELKLTTVHIEGTELLDCLVTSVFLLDHELRVGYLNAAAQTLLGLGSNQVLGRSITELTRGAETLLPLFDRARTETEAVVQRELAWPAPGGVDRILDCAVTQITFGPDLKLLLEIEDITQHRRLTRENALLAQLGGSRAVALRVQFAWLAGNLFLGSQLSWILRPFIGTPTLPVEFFRDEALKGNFFEAVLHSLQQIFQFN